MVAVVTGNNLGLVASSAGVLGNNGQLGSAATGRGSDAAFVNAATGNLTIQRQDELLLGLGPDIGIVRTYNSQGTFDFDNNDNWQISLYRRVFGLTGTVNNAASTIKRTSADGAELIYTYDTTLAKYVNKDGASSYDTLTYNSGTDKWTWVDGDTRTTETFELQVAGTYRIKTFADTDGNTLTYSYNNLTDSLITQILSANGERTDLIYNTATKQLTQINVVNSSNVTTTRIRYTYENATATARLTSVSTDLTPADGVIADGKIYTTTYTYDGASKRIASITNSDGTKTSFTYETTGAFRVLTVIDGTNNVTTFAYPTTSTTTITDPRNQVTTLTYSILTDSSQKLLTRILGPASSGQDINYLYDAGGNVTRMTDSRGNMTNYVYDTSGNLTRQEDAAGNTITRTYSSTNQLLTEVVYATPDTTPGDTTYNAALTQTTRYAYDVEEHLRFIVSPEGRVTEYGYNANGTRAAAIQYTNNLFSGIADEASLNTWVTTTVSDKTKSQRTDYTYDVRGQLSTRTTYATVNSSGVGVIDTNTSTTQYVYDQYGNMTQVIDARGVATTGIATDFITNYSYDGLNRLTSQTDAFGNVTTTIYNDTTTLITNAGTSIAANSVGVRLANGLVTINSYDLAGRLVSSTNTNATNTLLLGTTAYLYDNLGLLRQLTEPTGQVTYYLYDTLGRKVGVIDPQLALTEYVYNNNNQVVRIIQYSAAVTASLTPTTALSNTIATTGIRISTPATDRVSRNLFDKAGRLAKQIGALGAVTEYQYDGASRLLAAIGYANWLTVPQLTALAALTTEPLPADINTIPTVDANSVNNRTTRQLYTDDGLLAATLDAEGYLTEHIYNAAGQRISSIRYATITPSAQWASGALAALRPAVSAPNDQTTYNIYNARGQLEGTVDALGYLTEFQYDVSGNRINTIRYNTSITYTVGAGVAASRPTTNVEDQSTTNSFDDNNRLKTTTSNPDGLSSEYSYDSVGNLTQQVRTYTGAANTDKRSQFKQYDLFGRVTRELSGEGVLALQVLISPTQVQIDTVWDSYGTRYSYDLAGRVIVSIAANATTTGNKSLYYYDTEGKLSYQVNAVGEVTEFIYSKFDQRTATRQYKTRIVAATLASMQTVAATATTGVVSTTVNTAANTALTALAAGGYTETLTAYDNAGRAVTLTDALLNVNTRSYNAFGELFTATNKIDASNNVITSYAYDKRGMVKTTTEDATGINRFTQAVYDAFGRITQTTDGRGAIVNRSYDRLGREVTTTDALNTNLITTYDAFSRVLTRRDGRGVVGNYNTVSYRYNSTARSMTMTTAEGVSNAFSITNTRNRFGETVQITDGRGAITAYTYNADGQLKSSTTDTGTTAVATTSSTSTAYDAAKRTLSTTDARGTVTNYTYDAANRVLTSSADPTGLNLTMTYAYDALGRTTWVKDAKGIWISTVYDAKGQVTNITIDPTSIPDATNNPDNLIANATGLNLRTEYVYDARGKRLTVVEGFGSTQPKTTQYTYDKLGRLTQTAVDPTGLNLRTNYSYDKNDNVVLKIDANTNKMVYTYDKNNRLIYTVDALGYVTKNKYDVNGNVVANTAYTAITTSVLATLQTTANSPPLVNDADTSNRITRSVYDKDNRLTHSVDAAGYVTKLVYDANNNVVQRTRYVNTMVGTLATNIAPQILATAGTGNYVVTSTADRVEQTVYDKGNRAVYSIDALNYVTAYTYDSNSNVMSSTRYATALASLPAIGVIPSVTANALIDQTTQKQYDKANRTSQSTDALGNITKYSYDANGNQLTITEAFGTAQQRITTQEFDKANRKTAAVDALGNRTETTYDALGNITSIKDAKGNFGYYYYDAAARMTLQVDPEGAATQNTYDAFGNIVDITRFATKVVGASDTVKPTPTVVVASDQKQTITYNALNQKLNIKTWIGLTTSNTAADYYIESFTYNAFANALTSTARNAAVTSYTYDKLGRKESEILLVTSRNASNVAIAVVNNFAYDMAGNLTTKTEAAGLPEVRVTSYAYDKSNRLTTETGQSLTAFNPTTQADVVVTPTKTKTYDSRGNILTEMDANNNTSYYFYDALDRNKGMVTADLTYTVYVYDAVGNKTSQLIYANKVTTPTPGTAPTVTADAANDRTTNYTYDGLGRQLTVSISNITYGSVTNAVTGQYTVNTGIITTQTTYDALGNVTRQIDASGNVTRSWYNNAGQTIAKLDAAGYLTTWTRDSYGNISQETRYANKASIFVNGNITDGTTLIELINATSASVADRVAVIEYDKLNRVSKETVQGVVSGSVNTVNGQLLDANGQLVNGAATASANAITTYVYDGLNNIIQKTDATNAVTNWVYDNIGRQTSQINPQFVDYLGASVRPRTDMAYDGLNNVSREIKRGTIDTADATTASGQVETDDHISTFTYGAGGLLKTETDATGAVTEYSYDANSNITKKTLKNRLTADGIATDDVTTYTYDVLNRQVASSTKSTAEATYTFNQIKYNSFGQTANKRTYTNATGALTADSAGTWDEFANYDQAGRMWKSNSGDGITKVYVYDANGNATLNVTSTANISAVDKDAASLQALLNTPNTLRTMSVYDAKNQLITALQATMDGTRTVGAIITNTNTETANAPANPLTGSVSSAQTSANPIALGSATLGSGNVTYTKSYVAGSVQGSGLSGIGTSNTPRTHTVNISLPASATVGLGTGNTTVEITSTIYTPARPQIVMGIGSITPARPASTSVTIRNIPLAEGQLTASTVYSLGLPDITTSGGGLQGPIVTTDYTLALTALSVRVLKATTQGNVIIANQALSVGEVATVSQVITVPKRLYLAGQPTNTTKLLMSYRVVGSTSAYTTASAAQMVNSAPATMVGMFAFDYSAIAAGNYEYQYVALDASGNLLNQQSGTFNTITGVASAQTPIAAGGIGRAMLEGSNLTLVNQGSNAASVTMRYRVAGSNNWLTLPSFTKGTASAGIGLDSFSLANTNLSSLANATSYELDFEVYDTSGQLLRVVSNQLVKDASGGISISPLAVSKIRISGQPANTAYLDIATRAVGSLGAYTALTRVYPNNLGKFDLSILGISVGDKDVDMLAYDTNGVLVNHNQANIYFNQAQNIVTVSDLRAIDMQLPVQTNADYVIVGYRLTGTFNGYTMLPAQQLTIKNGVKQARINLPVTLAAGTYEYQYTAYLPDVLGTNPDDPLDTNYYVATPIGSSNGNFVIGTGTTANARLDWVLGTSTNQASIQRRQSYNAFGEIMSETDGRGNVTSLTYNTLGKLSQKIEASASITLDNGTKQTITPVTTYTYDAAGRMVSTIDANNNINTQAWLNGGMGEQTVFERHADGGFIKRGFDIFGNKVRETDRISSLTDTSGRTSQFAYDNVNRLTQITRPTGATDKYTYDAAGQRITHTNALNDTEKTYYDSLGRVTQTKTNMGFATTYTYTFNNNTTGIGGATASGWINTTTDTVGRTTVDKTDMFKRMVEHKDLGNHTTTYSYNLAGWLTTQASTARQNISYDHYANGYIKSIHDKTLGMFTYYEYDADGNKRYEGYVALKDKNDITKGFTEFYQQATITYDALNRMTKVVDPKASIEYQYDAVGNRRSVKSTYYEVGGASKVQEYWYKYDNMNRFLITMGTLNNGVISKGALGGAGVDISYNLAGERTLATNAINGNVEAYTYNVDGYLTTVVITGGSTGKKSSTRTNDALGRVTRMDEYSYDANNVATSTYWQISTYDKDNRTLTQESKSQADTTISKTWFDYYYDTADSTGVYNHYYAGGAGELAHTFTDSDGNGNRADGTIVDTNYGYEYWDEAKMTSITADPYNKAIKKSNNKWANGYSDITYDINGHINGAVDWVGKRNFRYVSDAQGLILFRDEITGTIGRPNYRYFASTYNAGSIANKVQRYYYVDGKVVGDVGNDGPSRTDYVTAMANRGSQKGNYANWTPVASADFDQNYEPISPTNPGAVASNYTVRNGDTLQSIASTVWGDAAMWYLIANANGLASGSTLSANMVLIIPNKVSNIHNNAGTFRPYNPGEAIGDLNPTIPAMPKPPKKKSCGGFFAIIAAVVAVVATIYTAGLLAPVLAGAAAPVGFSATLAAGATALSSGALGFGAAAVAGAVGSLAGQVAGNVLGIQSGISWGAVAVAGLSAGVGIKFYNGEGTLGTALNAAAKNVIGQGVSIIAGQQKGFNWTSVAVSAISAPISSKINKQLFGFTDNQGMRTGAFASQNRLLAGLGESAVNATVSELTRLTLEGGKLSWSSVAVNTVTSFTYKAFDDPTLRNNKYAVAMQQRSVPMVVDENSLLHYYSSNADGVHVSKDGEYTKELLSYRDSNQEVQTVAADSFAAQNAIAMGYEHVSANELYFGDTKLATYYGTPQTWIDATLGLTLGDSPNSFQRQVAIDGGQSPELQAISDKYIDAGSGQVNPLRWGEFTSATMQAGLSMVVTTNGLGNFYQQARDNPRGLAENNRSVVINIYNATTDGLFFADSIVNAIPRQLNEGFSTNQAVIQTQLKEAIEYNKTMYGEGVQLTKFISHSEGTVEGNLAVDGMLGANKLQLHVINVGTASWHMPQGVGKYDNIYDKNDFVTNLTHGGNLAKGTEFNHLIDMDSNNMGLGRIDTSESPQHHSFYLYLQSQEARNIMGLSGRPSIISRPF